MSPAKPAPMPSPQPPAPAKRGWFAWLVWLATEDHCVWANQYVYGIKTPLGILLACAFFSLLCGLFVAPQAYWLLAVIAAVIAVGVAWPSVAMRGLHCRLVFAAHRGREGKPTRAKLIVTNRWPWPVWGLAIDDPAYARAAGETSQTQGGQGAEGTTVALARIDGWSRSTYHWTFEPPLRGVYPNKKVRIVTGFPFGLRKATRPVRVDRNLTVWPQTFWLPLLGQHPSRRDWGGELTETLAGADGTRLGVRDYRQGDNLRDVHWAKSARHERLIVSEREASVVQDCRVFVEVDPTPQGGSGADSTLEWSLRIAASICESIVGCRGRVDLWLGKNRVTTRGPAGDLLLLMDAIANFDPESPATIDEATPPPRCDPRNTFRIGTDASTASSGRTIVMRGDAFGGGQREDREDQQSPWISIESPEDVPGQVLRGWRNATGRRRRGWK